MSFITETTQTDQDYTEIKERATRRFLHQLREFGRGFWAYTEETGEIDVKPFEGWQ